MGSVFELRDPSGCHRGLERRRCLVSMEDREHSWRIAVAALRAVLTASAVVALYYLLPLDHGSALVAELAVGLLVFVALIAWQVRAIMRSEHPEVRGLAALLVSFPLFIVLFASVYYLMSRADSSNFTSHLSRTDALYFTVTIFSTVGFGDITAKTESARLIVTAQIVLDLIIIGLGVRVILGAVQRSREQRTPPNAS
jgi:voltage-gated potassium channel